MTCPTCGKPQLTEQPHRHSKPKLPTWRLIDITRYNPDGVVQRSYMVLLPSGLLNEYSQLAVRDDFGFTGYTYQRIS